MNRISNLLPGKALCRIIQTLKKKDILENQLSTQFKEKKIYCNIKCTYKMSTEGM